MRNRHFVTIALILFLLTSSNFTFANFKSDTLFLKPFSHKFSARILFGIKEFSISISSSSKRSNSSPKVIYKPNNGVVGGIGLTYKNILIGYYFNISGTELNNREFGKTHIADYQVSLTNRFFYISGFHRTYNGFYVSKPYESYPGWKEGMPYPQRKDIIYNTKGIETIINLNPSRYSLNASLKFTEHQIQSVLAPLVNFNYSNSMVKADSSLIPLHLSGYFFNEKELYQTNFSGWTLMPGLSYSFVRNRWFFNPMLFTGFGYLKKELLFKDQNSEKYKASYFRINSRLNYGYNGKNFFTGIFFEWNEMFLPKRNLMIKTENLNLMLMLGLRF